MLIILQKLCVSLRIHPVHMRVYKYEIDTQKTNNFWEGQYSSIDNLRPPYIWIRLEVMLAVLSFVLMCVFSFVVKFTISLSYSLIHNQKVLVTTVMSATTTKTVNFDEWFRVTRIICKYYKKYFSKFMNLNE